MSVLKRLARRAQRCREYAATTLPYLEQREELLAALENLEQELRSVLSQRASKQRDRRNGLETRG